MQLGSINNVPAGSFPLPRLDRGYGYTLSQMQARTGIARHGLTLADLTEYTGPQPIPAGSTLDKMWFRSTIDMRNGGITITRSLIRPETPARGWFAVLYSRWEEASAPLARNKVIDCEITGELLDSENQAWLFGLDGMGDTIGCDIHNMGAGIAIRNTTGGNWDIEVSSNIIHDLIAWGNPATTGNHVDGFTIRDFPAGPGRFITMAKNYIYNETPNTTGSMFVQAWGNVANVTYQSNLFGGNGYNFILEQKNGATYSNINVIDNRFTPTGFGIGYRDGGAPTTWTGNFRHDINNPPTYAGSVVDSI